MAEKRLDWDAYFMEIANLTANRSTCCSRHVGAVIVKDQRIIATGYNGAPIGIMHCEERYGECLRQKLNIKSGKNHELCYAVHAEQSALIQCATNGVSCEGGTIYVTVSPCIICLKLLINAGIKKIVTLKKYPDALSDELLKESNITLVVLEDEKESTMENKDY